MPIPICIGTGGAERYATELGELFTELGHSVTIFSASMRLRYPDKPRTAHPCRIAPIQLLVQPGTKIRGRIISKRTSELIFNRLCAAQLIGEHLTGHGYDVIYGQAMGALAGLYARRVTHTPVICASYNFPWGRFADYSYRLATQTDGLVTLNQYTMERHLTEAKEHIAPHLVQRVGINHARFCPANRNHALRQRLGVGEDELMVLSLQRMDGRKKMIPIMESFLQLAERHKHIRFIIGGTGPNLSAFQEWAAQRNAGDLINFVGYVPAEELGAYYASSDIFIGATYGYVTLEAMASGVATVIMNHQPQCKEFVEDGISGILVEESADAIYEKLNLLIENPSLRHSLSEGGIQFVRKNFNNHVVTNQLLTFFEEVSHPSVRF